VYIVNLEKFSLLLLIIGLKIIIVMFQVFLQFLFILVVLFFLQTLVDFYSRRQKGRYILPTPPPTKSTKLLALHLHNLSHLVMGMLFFSLSSFFWSSPFCCCFPIVIIIVELKLDPLPKPFHHYHLELHSKKNVCIINSKSIHNTHSSPSF
jgi:hypothetical protein